MQQRRPIRAFTRRQVLATGGALIVPAAILAWWRPWQDSGSPPDDSPRATVTPAPPTATRAPERIALPTARPDGPVATPATPATPTAPRAAGTLLYLGKLDGQPGIIAVGADGSNRRMLVPGVYEGFAWSPNGDRFAATGPLRSGFTAQVAIFDAEGRPLARYAFDGMVGNQAFWSPSGDTLACTVTPYPTGPTQNAPTETWQITMWGEVRRVLVPAAGSVMPFAWTPAGLLMVNNFEPTQNYVQDQRHTLWTASADGTHAVREVEGPLTPLALALDGETLYAIRQSNTPPNQSLIALALRTDTPRTIGDIDRLGEFAFGAPAAPDTYSLNAITFAPDRTHFAIVVTNLRTTGVPPQSKQAIVFVRLDGVVTGSLRFPPDSWPSLSAWSPDGTMLAYASYGGSSAGLTLMDTRGTPLFQSPYFGYSGTGLGWSPDGRWLAYAHLNGIAMVSPNGLPAYALDPVGGVIAWQPRPTR